MYGNTAQNYSVSQEEYIPIANQITLPVDMILS